MRLKFRKAAEGLEKLQQDIAQSGPDQMRIPWAEFKAFVEEGRR